MDYPILGGSGGYCVCSERSHQDPFSCIIRGNLNIQVSIGLDIHSMNFMMKAADYKSVSLINQ